MDLALNNLQKLICHKIQPTNIKPTLCHNLVSLGALLFIIIGNEIGDPSSSPRFGDFFFTS